MIIILSPAKTLNFKTPYPIDTHSQPLFCIQAKKLIGYLKKLSPTEIQNLMKISKGLSELNFLRFAKWELDHTQVNSKQAIFAYSGEVYNGFKSSTLKKNQAEFVQKHVRIISGLYGILRPFDWIQPYRLEMSSKLSLENHKNLYSYWSEILTTQLNNELEHHKSKVIVNLASIEYSKSIQLKKLKGKVINLLFKELRGNKYQVITVYSKKKHVD